MLKIYCYLLIIFPNIALAYLGPGMAAGLFFSIVGIIIALILAIFALIWFPIKKLYLLFKKKRNLGKH